MKIHIYLRNTMADVLMYLAYKIRPIPRITSMKVTGYNADRVMTEEEYRLGGIYHVMPSDDD